MAENRIAPRNRVLKGGKIVLNDGRSVISCTVRNVSASGALLKVETVIGVPGEFLLIVGDEPPRFARVVRRTATELGIVFGTTT